MNLFIMKGVFNSGKKAYLSAILDLYDDRSIISKASKQVSLE